MKRMDISQIRGKRFSIIGAAQSGLAVAKLVSTHGARVFVSDSAPAEKMQYARATLDDLHVPYEFGSNSERILDTDFIVLSPGVSSDVPIVKNAAAQRIPVWSELEVASWFCRAPIVAITGTNGKTTTTTLVGRIFADARKPSVVSGNIGIAFSQVVEELPEESVAILEVSSFQLDTIDSFKPKVAVILNITPDHLDRYQYTLTKYIASKCRVFENQRKEDVLIYNYDDEITRKSVERFAHQEITKLPFGMRRNFEEGAFVEGENLKVIWEGSEIDVIPTTEISIRGPHNLYNAMAAAATAKVMEVSTASLRATLKNFKGVEHRLEFVREINGVTFVNDSKATNVESVWYALQSFEAPVIVLLGGRDKGNDYSRLFDLVKKHVKGVVAIGESADTVANAFLSLTPVAKARSMDEAVRTAAGLASAGDVVLLSPACASFDWFENYEHRGRVFKEIVWRLQSK